MGWVICTPNTNYTKELINKINQTLGKHLKMLKKYPAQKPRGYYSDKPFDSHPPST